MPLINVKVIEGVFTPEQKGEIVERLTDAMVSVEGENMRRHLVRHRRGQQRRLGYRRATPDHRSRPRARRRDGSAAGLTIALRVHEEIQLRCSGARHPWARRRGP